MGKKRYFSGNTKLGHVVGACQGMHESTWRSNNSSVCFYPVLFAFSSFSPFFFRIYQLFSVFYTWMPSRALAIFLSPICLAFWLYTKVKAKFVDKLIILWQKLFFFLMNTQQIAGALSYQDKTSTKIEIERKREK